MKFLSILLSVALLEQSPITDRAPGIQREKVITDLQVECIDIFVRVAQFLGLAKSFGEIYGLIFLSESPLCLDECIESLGLSKGAASQGLKQLKSLGAIKLVYVPGDRRDRYAAEESIKFLVAGFLKERVQPGLVDLQHRIENLENKIVTLPEGDQKKLRDRLHRIQSWQKKGQSILPVINSLLIG